MEKNKAIIYRIKKCLGYLRETCDILQRLKEYEKLRFISVSINTLMDNDLEGFIGMMNHIRLYEYRNIKDPKSKDRLLELFENITEIIM